MNARHIFSFDALCAGKLGLTPAAGTFLAESAAYCLLKNDHPAPVKLNITGDAETSGTLGWARPDEKKTDRTYSNQKEVAEDGAYAVAIIVVTQLEKFPAVAKSPIGTGNGLLDDRR